MALHKWFAHLSCFTSWKTPNGPLKPLRYHPFSEDFLYADLHSLLPIWQSRRICLCSHSNRQCRSECVQFSSVAQSCLTLCDPMNRRTPGLPVHHQLPKSTQTHVHWVGDAIQPSHPLSSPSPALNLSQHQGLFQWVSSSHQVARVLEFHLQHQSFQWTPRTDLLKAALTWFIYRIVSFFKMEFCFNTRTASSLSFLIASSATVWPQSLL